MEGRGGEGRGGDGVKNNGEEDGSVETLVALRGGAFHSRLLLSISSADKLTVISPNTTSLHKDKERQKSQWMEGEIDRYLSLH